MTLLKWALIFFLVSVVAGILGFTGISAAPADIAPRPVLYFCRDLPGAACPGAHDLPGVRECACLQPG
jgi:uncharacterized membrane protein YtjA (UPF0391 family)